MLSFEQANAQQELSKSLLRLTATLQQSMLPFLYIPNILEVFRTVLI